MSDNSELQLIEEALPGYEIGAELGRGAWGVVLSGRHKALGRRVAIKQLPRSFAADPGVANRFLREAQMAASLDHPHIVPVYDYVEKGGLGLIVMEQCSTTVGAKFQSVGLHTDEACYAALATCSGLAYAHGRGVLHRDIKPENLLMDADGTVKVGDFGIARAVDEATRLTAAGTVIGTPAYMSPEQASGRDLGPPSDVYSIGVVLYELLSGELPFTDVATFGALIRQHLLEPPRPLLDVAREVPVGVAEVIDRALAKDPNGRWESAAAFGVALGEATSQAFGASWPRQRGFFLSGAAEILAATEREISGSGSGSGGTEAERRSVKPPVRPTGTGPSISGETSTAALIATPTPTPPTSPVLLPAPTSELASPAPDPVPPPPGVTGSMPPAPSASPAAPGGRQGVDWAPPTGTSSPAGKPQWPAAGPPVADTVAGSSGGGSGPIQVAAGSGGSSKAPWILGGAVALLLVIMVGVGLSLASGGNDDDTTGRTTIPEEAVSGSSTPGPVAGGDGAATGDALVLSALIDTGEFSSDEDQAVALDLAIDDIAAAGGVLGQPLVMLAGPYTDTASLALTAGQHLSQGVTAFVGPTDPVDTNGALGVVTAGGAVLMSPTDFFSRADSSGLYFQTRVPTTLVGEAAASLIDDNADSVVLIRPAGSFAADESVVQAVVASLDGRAIDVNVVDVVGDDFDRTAIDAASLGPDAVLVYGVIDKMALYAALIDVGLRPSTVPYVAIADDGAALDSGDGRIAGVRGVTVDFLTGNSLEDRLPATSLSASAAQAYDAVIVLALAAEQAGATDGSAIAEALPLVTGGGQECTDYAACKTLLADGVDINYVGPGGTYDLSPTTGRPQSGYFQVSTVGESGFTDERQRLTFDRNS